MKGLKNRVFCWILLLQLVCWSRGDLAVIEKVFEKQLKAGDPVECPDEISQKIFCLSQNNNPKKILSQQFSLYACLLIRYDTAFTREHCVYWLFDGKSQPIDFTDALQYNHSAEEVFKFLLPYNYRKTANELSFSGLDEAYLAFNEKNNEPIQKPLASFPMFDQIGFGAMAFNTFKIRTNNYNNNQNPIGHAPLHVGIHRVFHETLQASGWGLFVDNAIKEDITMILITLEQNGKVPMMRFELLDGPIDTQIGHARVQHFPYIESPDISMSYSYKEESNILDIYKIKFELYGLQSFMHKDVGAPFTLLKKTIDLSPSSIVPLQKLDFGAGKTIKSLFTTGHGSLLLMMHSKDFSINSIKNTQALCGSEINISLKVRKPEEKMLTKIKDSQTCRVDMWKLVSKMHPLPFSDPNEKLDEKVLARSPDILANYIHGCTAQWSGIFSLYKQYLIPSSSGKSDSLTRSFGDKFEWLKNKPEPRIGIEQKQTYFCLPVNHLNLSENTPNYCPTNLKLFIKSNKDIIKLDNACYKFDEGKGDGHGYTFRLPAQNTGVHICTDFDSLFITHINFHSRIRQGITWENNHNHQRLV